MPLILNIDTAVENASVCLAKKGVVIDFTSNPDQKDHASWLLVAIQKLVTDNKYTIEEIEAVAVSSGPGSYTGLRVGLSTAKGLCYALKIPLITVNTLEVMAFSAKEQAVDLISPMIDARRMEVYTAVYDKNMAQIVPGHACILNPELYSELLKKHQIIFIGNGSLKFKPLVQGQNADFPQIETNARHLADISSKYFENDNFADLAYSEPYYLKDFYTLKKPLN